jgi:hypothetical protein
MSNAVQLVGMKGHTNAKLTPMALSSVPLVFDADTTVTIHKKNLSVVTIPPKLNVLATAWVAVPTRTISWLVVNNVALMTEVVAEGEEIMVVVER